MITVVFFHIDRPSNHPFMQMQGGAVDYHALIPITVAHARQSNPGANIVMLTDRVTQFRTIPADIIRLDIENPDHLMFERSKAQRDFAKQCKTPALYLDTDVRIRGKFEDWFDRIPFDIGVSWRDEIPGQPINGGMLIAKTPERFAHFMDDFVKMHEAIALAAPWAKTDLRTFRGGQLALSTMLYDKCTPGLHKTHWGTVMVAPADEINRTYQPCFAEHGKGHRWKYLVQEG